MTTLFFTSNYPAAYVQSERVGYSGNMRSPRNPSVCLVQRVLKARADFFTDVTCVTILVIKRNLMRRVERPRWYDDIELLEAAGFTTEHLMMFVPAGTREERDHVSAHARGTLKRTDIESKFPANLKRCLLNRVGWHAVRYIDQIHVVLSHFVKVHSCP